MISQVSLEALAQPVTPVTARTPRTLDEWFQAAKSASPKVRGAKAQLDSANYGESQALATLFPKISTSYTYDYTNARAPRDSSLLGLGFKQNIFKGFAEYSGLNSAQLFSDAAEESLKDLEIQLQYDTAKVLIDLSLSTLKRELFSRYEDVLRKRTSELQSRVKIGKSRNVDSWETEIETLNLERRRSTADEDQARSLAQLVSLTGVDSRAANIGITLDELVGQLSRIKGHRKGFDLRARELAAEAQVEKASALSGGYWPQLTGYGNYYPFATGNQDFTQDKWNLGVTLGWDLFSGGETRAQVGAARAQAIVLEQDLKERQRLRAVGIRELRIQRSEAEKQRSNLERAKTLSARAFSVQERDYRLGVVTSLETLSTLQSGLEIEIELATVKAKIGALYAESLLLGEAI